MRILFVHPAAQMSISDVARGYRSALERAGHEVSDYWMAGRMEYHFRAMPDHTKGDQALLARQASENILNEALYHEVDLVLVVSGLNVHPIFLWLLNKVNPPIPAAVILTESPYDDESQAEWASLTNEGMDAQMTIFTNDRYSAEQRGWNLLAPSFDPSIHRPVPTVEEEVCDVLMIGTGWAERQAFLEAVNWGNADVRLYGMWPGLKDNPRSPLHRFYRPLIVDNVRIASMYCSARICLNFHRRNPVALTPNPRVFEVAACGGFQLSDPRPDLASIFGDTVPTFDTPDRLGDLVNHYLAHTALRTEKAHASRRAVQGHTFDNRVAYLMNTLSEQGIDKQTVAT